MTRGDVMRSRQAAQRTNAVLQATPLARALTSGPPRARATLLDLLQLARKKWLAGERIDIGRLAEEQRLGRATVFRWVGTREQLYGEVLSVLFLAVLEDARGAASGHGAAYIAGVTRRALGTLLASQPLRGFVAQDPEFALRVLTSKSSPVAHRSTSAVFS